jgi:hypothetical protein
MTVKELREMLAERGEQYVEESFVEFIGGGKTFHTDNIKDYIGIIREFDEVEDWSVMDCEEMNSTIFANTCIYAEDCYGENDKVLVIAIKKVAYYKDYPSKYIGESDIANLTLRYCKDGIKYENIHFGGDGSYDAYIVDDEDVYIGEHYELVISIKGLFWFEIIDDKGVTYSERMSGGNSILNIYRAGSYGIIIQTIREG